jgi:hypothetical protein
MPIALLSMLAACRICKIVLAAAALTALFLGFIAYERHEAAAGARAKVIAEQAKLTAAESERRQKVIADARQKADLAVAANAALQRRNAGLTARINDLSRRNDTRACLDPDGVRRLNQVGQPAGRGTAGG